MASGDLLPSTDGLLRRMGEALDAGSPLRVHNQGYVRLAPDRPAEIIEKESNNARPSQRRSSARSRQGPPRRQGPSRRSGSPGAAPRLGGLQVRAAFAAQLAELEEAYPGVRVLQDPDGLWLVAESAVLADLSRRAVFLIALPDRAAPRGWGFWLEDDEVRWIGPRHTNFEDGSICAFAPADDAWSAGRPLTTLLDLYTVWALRHLHLERVGRWPGKQYALTGSDPRLQAYYRLVECRDDELCGCGSETMRYADCCKPTDQRLNMIALATFFLRTLQGGFQARKPQAGIVEFAKEREAAPALKDVHIELRSS